ncbi:MAG: TIGR02594 family protein [Rhizobiales bacterium]|nr:TIGR02594 family protein [Hyphomicrobiales bacterium]
MQFIPANLTPATMLALLLACSALTSPAFAKPRNTAEPAVAAVSNDERYPAAAGSDERASLQASTQLSPSRVRSKTPVMPGAMTFGGGDVVSEARRWIGGNPTGRSSLWCGAFMDFVLKRTGHAGGGNLARDYANYGRRLSGPQVGAIAVMSRGKDGGHVGVVSGIDENGNPIIISGNHGNRVAESAYPRGRIYAYVMP